VHVRLPAARLDLESWPPQRPDCPKMPKTNQPIEIRSIVVLSQHHSFERKKRNTCKVFVTGVPVNIHRNLAPSCATTLLARVALKYNYKVSFGHQTHIAE
jgi:hypothetical protein